MIRILVQDLIGLVGVIYWLCGTGGTLVPQSKPLACCEPIWTAQVAESYESPILFQQFVKSPILRHHENAGVVFLDANHLVVYGVELTRELSSRVSADISSAFRLRASFFDASSGKLTLTKDWGTRATRFTSSIHITTGGMLVRAGEQIRFYSRDFVELQRLPLSQADPQDEWTQDEWIISVSTSGKTVLLNHYDQKQSYFEVRDGDTLEVRKSWSEAPPLRHLYSTSDTAIAAADSHQQHILLSEFGSRRWKILSGSSGVGCVGSPLFVSNILLVDASCGEFSLLSAEGEKLMTDHAERHEGIEWPEAAREGRMIAVSLNRGKGGGFFDTDVHRTGNRIAVYDLSLRRRVLTLDVIPLPKNEYDFALSPDGSKLAVLNDRKVSVYSVPTL